MGQWFNLGQDDNQGFSCIVVLKKILTCELSHSLLVYSMLFFAGPLIQLDTWF